MDVDNKYVLPRDKGVDLVETCWGGLPLPIICSTVSRNVGHIGVGILNRSKNGFFVFRVSAMAVRHCSDNRLLPEELLTAHPTPPSRNHLQFLNTMATVCAI
jgi:hypothetical protein